MNQYTAGDKEKVWAHLSDLVDDGIYDFSLERLHHNGRVLQCKLCISWAIENPTSCLQVRQIIDTVDGNNITKKEGLETAIKHKTTN
jgi:hypothetical protein